MQKIGGTSNLTAEDLAGYLNCRYLTELDLVIANGELEKPKIRDPALDGGRYETSRTNRALSSISRWATAMDEAGLTARRSHEGG